MAGLGRETDEKLGRNEERATACMGICPAKLTHLLNPLGQTCFGNTIYLENPNENVAFEDIIWQRIKSGLLQLLYAFHQR